MLDTRGRWSCEPMQHQVPWIFSVKMTSSPSRENFWLHLDVGYLVAYQVAEGVLEFAVHVGRDDWHVLHDAEFFCDVGTFGTVGHGIDQPLGQYAPESDGVDPVMLGSGQMVAQLEFVDEVPRQDSGFGDVGGDVAGLEVPLLDHGVVASDAGTFEGRRRPGGAR